jgi:hypothetical protein
MLKNECIFVVSPECQIYQQVENVHTSPLACGLPIDSSVGFRFPLKEGLINENILSTDVETFGPYSYPAESLFSPNTNELQLRCCSPAPSEAG